MKDYKYQVVIPIKELFQTKKSGVGLDEAVYRWLRETDMSTRPTRKRGTNPTPVPMQQTQQAAAPDPHISTVEHPPSSFEPFQDETPTLQQRTVPSAPNALAAKEALSSAYNDPHARLDRFTGAGQRGANAVGRARLSNGADVFVKPEGGLDQTTFRRTLGDVNARHQMTHALASMAGYGHMVPAGMVGDLHKHWAGHRDLPEPDEMDSPEKQAKMMSTHLGKKAFMTQSVHPDAVPAGMASKEQLDKVDPDHRRALLFMHSLMGHPDAHAGNVMLVPHGDKYHPAMIDNDDAYQHAVSPDDPNKNLIRSIAAPGGRLGANLDNSPNPGEPGNAGEFHPREQKMLDWLAAGGHKGWEQEFGAHPDDLEVLKQNAQQLRNKGLKGYLADRDVQNS